MTLQGRTMIDIWVYVGGGWAGYNGILAAQQIDLYCVLYI